MMRIEIAIHAQRGGMGRDFAQQSMFNEKTKVVVDRGQRDMWNPLAHGGVNLLRGTVAIRGHNRLVDDVPLVGCGQAALPSQVPELGMREAHSYWVRMIIKHRTPMSNALIPW